MKLKKSGNLRKGRVSIDNQIYLITTVTNKRKLIFSDLYVARILVAILNDRSLSAETLCFVVMPDHLHWLLQLKEKANISSVVQTVKSRSGYYIKRKLKLSENLWQAGFYDHALRKEEDIKSVARYIIANPLRAGLVESIGDYSLWDACWLE